MRACRTAVAAATSLPVSVAFLPLALAGLAEAGPPLPITWGSATTVSGDSDVSTSGTLLYAYNVGASGVSSATVNTVTFASYVFPSAQAPAQTVTVGSVTFTESPGYLWGSNSLGSSSAPFSNLSSGYKTLLGSAGGADNPVSITATLDGLTVGNQYQLQIWTSNPSNAYNPYSTPIGDTTFTAGNSVTLDPNNTDAPGGLGQYVIGTFTADGVSRTFTMHSSGFNTPSLSAFQVRDVTVIPGPGGAALAAIVGAMRLGGRRRR